MASLWIIVIALYTISPVRSVDLLQPSFLSVKPGEHFTLVCPFGDNHRTESVIWYQQRFGEMPQKIGERLAYKEIKISPAFERSGFTLKTSEHGISLKIPQVNRDHGGLYYCERFFNLENVTLSNGTFLSVRGDEDEKVLVFQSSVSDSVPAGASVTLQCSVLSESRAAELQVLWFRAAPSQSHPQIIYTHHNSSLQCESESSTHTCVSKLSKNIFSLNDTGTYYCAVVLCGKIIFGNGTLVQLENCASSNPVVMSLGTVLVMCGILISVQAALLCQRKNSQQHRERIQHGAITNIEKTNVQAGETVELNYAALQFNDQKTKKLRKNRGQPQESVYAEMKYSSITH